jgi:tRNA(fMet)-specific endonuclease VapC
MRYLLDTNICIYIARQKPPGVLERLQRLRPGDVGMSVTTYLELVYGAWKSQHREANLVRIKELEPLIPVLPMDASTGWHYGQVRAELERTGSPIGAYDLLIAAHALSLGLTLVTNNVREFRRIAQLRVENWAEEQPQERRQ